jgi:hypothetical protein
MLLLKFNSQTWLSQNVYKRLLAMLGTKFVDALIKSVKDNILLVNLKLVTANTIKIKVNIVVLLLKSFLFELIDLKIHVNFVIRSNAIENNCKNCETIHLLFFSIRSYPSVKPLTLKLLNSLESSWR